MKDILLVGAGKIGSMIADFLARSGDYRVTVADHSAQALTKLETGVPVQTMVLDVKTPPSPAVPQIRRVLRPLPGHHLIAAPPGEGATTSTYEA